LADTSQERVFDLAAGVISFCHCPGFLWQTFSIEKKKMSDHFPQNQDLYLEINEDFKLIYCFRSFIVQMMVHESVALRSREGIFWSTQNANKK
jgi:hypothetical protein